MKDPPSHSTEADEEEAGTFSLEAPVRSSQWTLTVTGAGQGAIDKTRSQTLTQAPATNDLLDRIP